MTNTDIQPSAAIQIELIVSAWGNGLKQLCESGQLSEAQVLDAASKGGLWRKKSGAHKLKRHRSFDDITAGDHLFLNFDQRVLAQTPLVPILISDQRNYSVWNKPSGMLSQGSKWSDHCTITETVKRLHAKPSYLVHRLDKAASGLIVVAHTKNALKKLTAMFADKQVEKQYTVRVQGQFEHKLPMRLDKPVDGKSAITDVLHAAYNEKDKTSLLRVDIKTGRKHQIRAHLSAIGLPVVGDRLFDTEREHVEDLQLVAHRLAFQCPFTQESQVFEMAPAD